MARIQYRRRLRSRIIISFALFGFALTALFAIATLYMRARLEDQLINNTLAREVKNFVDFKRENPDPNAPYKLSSYDIDIKGPAFFANVPFSRQKYDETGVYDIEELGSEGKMRPYKLAVYKDQDYWAFMRLDISTQKLNERQLLTGLAFAVLAFAILSLVIGRWLSRRVMSPVAHLAERISEMRQSGKPEHLAPHFAKDEVGQVAAALDGYYDRLTALVERDREFNADVSHELRTPLASLIGFIDTLRGPAADDPPAQQRFLAIMGEQAARMNRLIDDLLSLSRIELVEHQPPSGSVDLGELATRLIAGFEPRLRERSVQLDVRIPVDLLAVIGDADQLVQVLQNLLDNAVKYGREGGTVRFEIAAATGRAAAVITVTDQGAGIPREHLPRLTERFYRVDTGRSRAAGGTGLGLAIVKHIVNRHRGQLSIESEEGVGTAVRVWLPQTVAQRQVASDIPA